MKGKAEQNIQDFVETLYKLSNIKHNLRTNVIYIKNIFEIRDMGPNFTWFIAKANIRRDRPTNFKLLDDNNINECTTSKTKSL